MISTAIHTTPTPKDWQKLRIKDVSSVNSKSLGNDTNPYYQFKYVDIGNVNQNGIVNEPETIQFHEAPSRARRIVIEGDVIVSTVRTYLKAVAYFNFNPKDYIVSTGFAVLSHTKKINPAYLSYFCQSEYFIDSVIENSKGVSYPAINATELSCLSVYYPPIKEQTAIAEYLDTKTQAIDKKVSLLEKKIGYYQELRKSLINETVTKGLDKNAELKDSGIDWIGQIPEHWEVKRIKDIFSTLAGGTPSTQNQEYWIGNIPWIPSGKVQNNDVLIESVEEYISDLALRESSTKIAKKNSVLIALTGATCSNIGYLTFDTTINQSIVALYPQKRNQTLSRFYFYFLMSAKEKIRTYMTGGAQGGINQEDVRFLDIVYPSKEEQEEIVKFLDAKLDTIAKIITNIQAQITTLKELRKTLINDVVTGKIKVSHE